MKQIELNVEEINKIDLSKYNDLFVGTGSELFFLSDEWNHAGQEHYRLFAYLSLAFDNADLLDIGMWCGASAISLAYNPTNHVNTFDITTKATSESFLDYVAREDVNITMNIDSFLDIKYEELILNAELISIDIDHSGILEYQLISFLKAKEWKGLLIMDDIDTHAGVKRVFDGISNLPKWNIKKYGHGSGTGLINFSDNIEIVLE